MIIRVTSTKTIKYKDIVLEVHINGLPGSKFCAVSLLREHFARFPAEQDEPLFMKRVEGQIVPIKYKEVLAFLKKMLSLVGKDPTTVGLHSLRRAGSFHMHQLGVPLEDIKCVVYRWEEQWRMGVFGGQGVGVCVKGEGLTRGMERRGREPGKVEKMVNLDQYRVHQQ